MHLAIVKDLVFTNFAIEDLSCSGLTMYKDLA